MGRDEEEKRRLREERRRKAVAVTVEGLSGSEADDKWESIA